MRNVSVNKFMNTAAIAALMVFSNFMPALADDYEAGANETITMDDQFGGAGTNVILNNTEFVHDVIEGEGFAPYSLNENFVLTDGSSNSFSLYYMNLDLYGAISGSGNLMIYGNDTNSTVGLYGNSTYSGNLRVNNVTVNLYADDALSATGTLELTSDVVLNLNGTTQHISTISSTSSSQSIVLNGGNLYIDSDEDSEYYGTFGGGVGHRGFAEDAVEDGGDPEISDTVLKYGSGTLTLKNESGGNYMLDIVEGAINFGDSAGWSGDLTVRNGARLTGGDATIYGFANFENGSIINPSSEEMPMKMAFAEGGEEDEAPPPSSTNFGRLRFNGDNGSGVAALFKSGSILEINIDSDGRNDVISSSSGDFTIETGAKLKPIALGTFTFGEGEEYKEYTFMESGNVINGEFDIVDINPLLQFSAEVVNPGEGYWYYVLRATEGSSFEEAVDEGSRGRTIGRILDEIADGGDIDDDMQALMDGLRNAEDLDEAYQRLLPDGSGSAPRLTSGFINQIQNLVGQRVSPALSGISSGDAIIDKATWVQGFYNQSKQDATNGIEGYDADSRGFALGADGEVKSGLRLGVALGYGKTSSDNSTDNMDLNATTLMAYGSYETAGMVLDAMASYSLNNYETARDTGGFGIAVADYDGSQYALRVDATPSLGCTPAEQITWAPILSARYSHLTLDGYSESGAPGANLTLEEQKFDTLTAGVGVKLSTARKAQKGMTFQPSASIMYSYDIMQDDVSTTARFVSGGSSFKTDGITPSRGALELSAEATLADDEKGMDLSLSYGGEYRSNFASHTGLVRLRQEF